MARLKKTYGTMPPQRFDGIVLRLRKQGQAGAVLTIFTMQQGLRYAYMPASAKMVKAGMGRLQPFCVLSFNAWERDTGLLMGEYESNGGTLLNSMSLEQFAYGAVFIEMVTLLLPEKQADSSVYELLKIYGRFINLKDSRIVTVIAGWQLIERAGYMPDPEQVQVYQGWNVNHGQMEYYLSDELPVDENLHRVELSMPDRNLWKSILSYRWSLDETIQIRRQGIDLLECVLYDYVMQCTDKPLQSIQQLKDLL